MTKQRGMRGRKRIELPVEEIAEAYEKGIDVPWLAEYFEVSIPVIYKRLGEAGVTMRGRTRAATPAPLGPRGRAVPGASHPPVSGPNSWLNALPDRVVRAIEERIENRDTEFSKIQAVMVRVGSGFDAPHRRAIRRDPISNVLLLRTFAVAEPRHTGPGTTCLASHDGGKTWEAFDPPKKRKKDDRMRAPILWSREAVRFDLRRAGLLT